MWPQAMLMPMPGSEYIGSTHPIMTASSVKLVACFDYCGDGGCGGQLTSSRYSFFFEPLHRRWKQQQQQQQPKKNTDNNWPWPVLAAVVDSRARGTQNICPDVWLGSPELTCVLVGLSLAESTSWHCYCSAAAQLLLISIALLFHIAQCAPVVAWLHDSIGICCFLLDAFLFSLSFPFIRLSSFYSFRFQSNYIGGLAFLDN